MKLRYQMRGLGVGIVVTALLMGVATKDKLPLTDAEVRAKAYELGMVESDSLRLTDIGGGTPGPQAPKETMPPRETRDPEGTVPPRETRDPEKTVPPRETRDPEETGPPEKTAAPTALPMTEPTDEPGRADAEGDIAIVINRGADSYSVSRQLEEAGLVSDMREFDRYLCDNGYAGRICVGTFWITPGSSEEQIAKIITRTG